MAAAPPSLTYLGWALSRDNRIDSELWRRSCGVGDGFRKLQQVLELLLTESPPQGARGHCNRRVVLVVRLPAVCLSSRSSLKYKCRSNLSLGDGGVSQRFFCHACCRRHCDLREDSISVFCRFAVDACFLCVGV